MRLVERDQLPDVDVGDAVAVGQQEQVLGLDVAADRRDASAGHGVLAGLGERDVPVFRVGACPWTCTFPLWSETVTSLVIAR